jgi:epoxyqueuosine reductase
MLSQKIKTKAVELGYTACGIIPADPFDEYVQELEKRSEIFPESKKYYDNYRNFYDLPESGKSIIVCTQRYNRYKVPKDVEAYYGKMYLFDNRIDYTEEHRVNTEFEAYIKMLGLDILEATVPARWAGARAGLGKFGHNNFLYDDKHGSFIIIEAWVVDKELEYDDTPDNIYLSACNDNCRKCIKACSTKALSDKLLMDTGKCICRIQFDGKDAISKELREQMGVWIYGCDDCQDVCPVNKDKFKESAEYPLLSEYEELMGPESILDMDENTYKNILNPRFWYAGEDSLWLWKCNALRSMINSGDSKFHSVIKKNCENADDRVKEIAIWGCEKLRIFDLL